MRPSTVSIDQYRTRRVHDRFDGDDAWPDPGPLDNEPNDATRELARWLQPLLDEVPAEARDALTRVDVDGPDLEPGRSETWTGRASPPRAHS